MYLLEGIHKIYYAIGGNWHASLVTLRNIILYKALMSPDQRKPSDLHHAMELIVTSENLILSPIKYSLVKLQLCC